MSYQITVTQEPENDREWRFTAAFSEPNNDGAMEELASANVVIAAMSGMQDNELFLEGARLALARLEADTA